MLDQWQRLAMGASGRLVTGISESLSGGALPQFDLWLRCCHFANCTSGAGTTA